MRCLNCGSELIAEKAFCHACGARAPRVCVQCGSTIESGFRFCPECGAPTANEPAGSPPALPDRVARLLGNVPTALADKIRAGQGLITGERKLVTVLFCDLVGSTAIAERLDPEEYRDLLDRYMAIAFREIYRFEGIVNQLAGDGMMALFGAPIAHEDAPHRAVHAALAIRDELRDLDAELRARHGVDLRLRIGIHTGPVVVGAVGNDLKMDYTAIGDTTNLASRLQTIAEPGGILISEATERLVRGFFDLAPARRVEVKGKAEPVIAYPALAASAVAGPMAIAEARGLTPLVGRREELAQLLACQARLTGHLAQVVAVVGPAGSGKSRLIYEFTQRLAGTPIALFEARCSAMMQSVPYAPWVTMLRQYFEIAPDEAPMGACAKLERKLGNRAAELAGDHPLLCRLLTVSARGEAPGADGAEDEDKRRTFEAVARLVALTSERAPVVMIIEDLHWIDDASREMLDLAVDHIQRGRVILLASHRPDYVPTWRVRGVFTQLPLAPLSDEDTTTIMRSVAGGALPAELEERLLLKAEGNPFFAEEITRALVEEGFLLRGDGQVRLTRPVAEVRLPGTVEELIGARLDRLGAHAKRVLQVAAVLGRQFHRPQLERVLEGEGIDLGAELGTLERRGVIHRKAVLSDDEFRFGESLTQQVAYESLLLKQRRELHERIGLMIETLTGPPTPERAALLAHHFTRSDNRARAVSALIHAAQDAERVPSFRTATRFYHEAWPLALETLSVAESDLATQRLALQAAHGICRMAVIYGLSENANIEEIASRGRALAERLGDIEVLGDLYALHGMAMTAAGREKFETGRALVEEGFAITERAGLRLPTIRTARALAWGYLFDGRFAQAEEKIEWALGQLAQLDDARRPSDLALGARFLRDRMRYHHDDLAGALAGANDTYALAVGANNRTVQGGSAATLALVHLTQGDHATAREWADRAIEVAQAIGSLSQLRTAAAVAALACLDGGNTSASRRYFDLLEQGLPTGPEPLNLVLHVEALLAAGDAPRAEQYARRAHATAGGRLRDMICATALGDAILGTGLARVAEARRCYEHAAQLAGELGVRSIAGRAEFAAAEILAALGDTEAARSHAAAAVAIFHALGFERWRARAERFAARLAGGVQESA